MPNYYRSDPRKLDQLRREIVEYRRVLAFYGDWSPAAARDKGELAREALRVGLNPQAAETEEVAHQPTEV